MKKIKCPRALGRAEISPRNKQISNSLALELVTGREVSEKRADSLRKAAFELSGVNPYLFDIICYMCTCQPHLVEHTDDNNSDTHYRMALPWSVVIDAAFDGYDNPDGIASLRRGLRKIASHPEKKSVPLSKNLSIETELIRVDIVTATDDSCLPEHYGNLKDSKGRPIVGVFIEFYKPIWKSLLDGDAANAWFWTPKAFTARIHYAAAKYLLTGELRSDKEYGKVRNVRLLFIYMNMHDNKRETAYYDQIDMCRSCLPKNVQKARSHRYVLKNRYTLLEFVKKGLKFLNNMARDGFLEGISIIPVEAWIDRKTGKIAVRFQRSGKVSEFIDNIDVFPLVSG